MYSKNINYECENCNTPLEVEVCQDMVSRMRAICPICKNESMINSLYMYEN